MNDIHELKKEIRRLRKSKSHLVTIDRLRFIAILDYLVTIKTEVRRTRKAVDESLRGFARLTHL